MAAYPFIMFFYIY